MIIPLIDVEVFLGDNYRLVHWYKPDGSTWALINSSQYVVAKTILFTRHSVDGARAWAEKVIADLGKNEAVIGLSPEQMEKARKGMGGSRAETVPCAKCVKTEAFWCDLCDAQDCDLYTWHVDGNDLNLCAGCYRKAARAAIGGG